MNSQGFMLTKWSSNYKLSKISEGYLSPEICDLDASSDSLPIQKAM